ncbi:MAG: sigma-54 dependent transcriptional regulator, partial [Spirochaetes bacterium]|nr:sigma-54 dependent transcriptional regulator [Spirochaetota bacterium]
MVVLIDDELNIRMALKRLIELNGLQVVDFENGAKALEYIEENEDIVECIITDLVMPELNGKELFNIIKSKYPSIPVIIISGKATVEDAINLMKEGVYDFFIKPFENIDKIVVVIKKAIDFAKFKKDYELLKTSFLKTAFSDKIIGRSKKMLDIFETVSQIAPTKATVLIYGETGTGKELIAEAIHEKSGRQGELIKVNCSALTETLLESELFGHEKGAFTGAIRTKPGRFELADKGTIFLDEIGEISPSIQIKLLRILQHKEFERVGGEKPIKVDVRIIAATNKDLQELVKAGKFRDDLYWRLNVIKITLPPLRERKDDIPLLIKHFIDKFSKENSKNISSISPSALNILVSYSWPGNVRELENTIENMIVMSRDDILDIDDIPSYIKSEVKTIPDFVTSDEIGSKEKYLQVKIGTPLEELEKKYIEFTLSKIKNKAKVARMLGIGRKTL